MARKDILGKFGSPTHVSMDNNKYFSAENFKADTKITIFLCYTNKGNGAVIGCGVRG